MFAFGYGLDYMDVSFTNMTAVASTTTAAVPITVRVDMRNGAGAMGGGKVVQVYYTPPVSPSRLTR